MSFLSVDPAVMDTLQQAAAVAALVSPVVVGITETVKTAFPENLKGISTIITSIVAGALLGFIIPGVGFGVGILSALYAIFGITVAQNIGKKAGGNIVGQSDVTNIQAPDMNPADLEPKSRGK